MVKASYCNYSFVVRLRSYLKNITIVTLLVTNCTNPFCNKSLMNEKEER
jgi:hypothetical protein